MDLPDDLLIEAKKRAAEERKPLRALVEEALRESLERRRGRTRRPTSIRWVTVEGGLPEGLDPRDRSAMHDYLRDESVD